MAKKIALGRESASALSTRAARILDILAETYPDARCSLNYEDAWQLLMATILSAQCTDERVNQVTPALFARFGNPEAMASAALSEIELLIKSTGFFKNKAVSLREASRTIVDTHGGQVPADMESLTQLRGVGRKTANVVLGNVYAIPSLVVDTHAGRLARRMGFTREMDPVKVEKALMKILAPERWTWFGHLMISHGRAICTARKPNCTSCPVATLCPKMGVTQGVL